MSDTNFKGACEEINGMYTEKDGIQYCKVGSKQVDMVAYKPDEETVVVKDHSGRETKADKIDEVVRGTNWINFERPEDPVMITSAGNEVELHDFRKE